MRASEKMRTAREGSPALRDPRTRGQDVRAFRPRRRFSEVRDVDASAGRGGPRCRHVSVGPTCQPPARAPRGRAVAVTLPLALLAVFGLVSRPEVAHAAAAHPLHVAHAAVASDYAQASAAGLEVLRAGGNAADAACAVALALGVAHPQASGIGGGGFALVYIAKEKKVYALDFRETAPAALRPDSFRRDGKVDPALSQEGGLGVGVPGEVRGLATLVSRWGKLPFARCVAPAEKLARDGVSVSWVLEDVTRALAKPRETPEKSTPAVPPDPVFQKAFSRPLAAGDRLRRPELARTLALLRQRGPDAFYRGKVASAIVDAVLRAGGLMTEADLAAYRVKERTPLSIPFRGKEVWVMPPPSSGGIALAETLGAEPDGDLKIAAAFPTDHPLHVGAPAMIAPVAEAAEAIRAAARVLNIAWIEDALGLPARIICPRSTHCPRHGHCDGAAASRAREIADVRDEIIRASGFSRRK